MIGTENTRENPNKIIIIRCRRLSGVDCLRRETLRSFYRHSFMSRIVVTFSNATNTNLYYQESRTRDATSDGDNDKIWWKKIDYFLRKILIYMIMFSWVFAVICGLSEFVGKNEKLLNDYYYVITIQNRYTKYFLFFQLAFGFHGNCNRKSAKRKMFSVQKHIHI